MPEHLRKGTAILASLVAVASGPVPLAACSSSGGATSPAGRQLESEVLWAQVPAGANLWEAPTTTDVCQDSDRIQSRQMGLFVPDATQGALFYGSVLEGSGWTVVQRDEGDGNVRLTIKAEKLGDAGLMRAEVLGNDRRGTKTEVDGEWVVEVPDGWNRESDFVNVSVSMDTPCVSR